VSLAVYRAPGRVNLIGEHTDYNDGFVLPIALDRSTKVEASPRDDRLLVVRSRELGETLTVNLDDNPPGPTLSWIDYVRGMAAVLEIPRGADLSISSGVPIGAGLSSSAALEVACGYALLDIAGREVDLEALARAGQRAEHEFAGTRCGLMDQSIACFGRAGHAMLLDTRTLAQRHVKLPANLRVLVANTMVRHAHASGEYNARRADCEEGVAILARRRPAIRALRDAAIDDLDAVRHEMSNRVYRRCRHVITENARTLEAAAALAAGDAPRLGRLMRESHESLRQDYEVSCRELETMMAIVGTITGIGMHGARMTGGGFGGSIVAAVDADHVEYLADRLRQGYAAATGRTPDVWICGAGSGAEKVK
jgi:galactokinase